MEVKEHVIWKDSFFKENFNVDQCLSEYTQKSDLKTLRKELKALGDDLQQQMSDILKTETEDIVNLAEYLTNLNFKIENLSTPICQLREEVMMLDNLVSTAESSCKTMLDELKSNTANRSYISLKLGITHYSQYIDNLMSSSEMFDDLFLLERVVSKYTFEKNYMQSLGITSEEIGAITQATERKLLKYVNIKFLDAFQNNDCGTITCCLRMYDAMQRHNEAQEIFRKEVVKPFMEKVFNENNLDKHGNDIDQLYDEALNFMYTKMKILHDLQNEASVKNCNFTLNSFWKEFDEQIRKNLPNLTAPGNPELFQKRFRSTWNVLVKIADQCGDPKLVTHDDSFQEHLKRFHLPVYFEICYQKIASEFERCMSDESDDTKSEENEHSFHLNNTVVLWKCIRQCFSENIYIDQLADQFLKLSLMLLGRYLHKLQIILKGTSTYFTTADRWERFMMDALHDLDILLKLVASDTDNIDDTVFRIMNKCMRPIIINVFKVNNQAVVEVQVELKNKLVRLKYEDSSTHLYNVASIPRLYRKTNKPAPKDPSRYIIDTVQPIKYFHQKFTDISKTHTGKILQEVIEKLTKQYTALVQEVLTSVCKTEESLRRLKGRNAAVLEDNTPQDSMSDEMKIREQIKYDVEYFIEELYNVGSEESRKMMDILKNDMF